MATPPLDAKHRITWRTSLAVAIFGVPVTVAFLLPTYHGKCRRVGMSGGGDPAPRAFSAACSALGRLVLLTAQSAPLKVAIGIGGPLLAHRRSRRRLGHDRADGVLVPVPHKAEMTGQVASDLRCLDAGCEGMTVEQAVMSEPPSDRLQYPEAQRAWWIIWEGLYSDHISADAVKDQLAAKYGEQILL